MLLSYFSAALMAFHASAFRISVQEATHDKALSPAGSVTCLDPSGRPVDFWYAFKYPGNWEYAYMDSNHKLQTMPGAMGDGTSPVDRTLDQLYASKGELSYALWNDEPTNKGSVGAPKAHAKGVLAIAKSGFWLTHSVPIFPQVPDHEKNSKSSFPGAKEPTNAQSFLCVTIGTDAIPGLMKLFETDWMIIYSAADNAGLGGKFQEWALKDTHTDAKNASADSYVTTVTSLGGQAFTAFAKSAALNDDLYEALVAPHFKKDFIAETWQNGVGRIPSWKKGKQHAYTIENGAVVGFPGHDQFKESNDHSKWAVSMDGEVLCVGDINRQEGQTRRGGGTTCISDATYAKQILNVVVADEDGTPQHLEVDHDEEVHVPRGNRNKRKKRKLNDSNVTDRSEPQAPKRTRRGDSGPIAGRTRSKKKRSF